MNNNGMTIGCICKNCGNSWSEDARHLIAVKNSLYEHSFCTKCVEDLPEDFEFIFQKYFYDILS